MTNAKDLILIGSFLFPVVMAAQSLDPALLAKPLSTDWPSYSGDYSGKRYSALTQINQSNVKNLTLAWVSRLPGAPGAGGGRGGRGGAGAGRGGAAASTLTIGGEGTGDVVVADALSVKGSILAVNGVLYGSAPDHARAIDAQAGHEI